MADKKKNRQPLSRRGRERLRKAVFKFDLVSGLLLVVIVIAMFCSCGEAYELGRAHAPGFAIWFLLFIAYVPLALVGGINWMFGIQDNFMMRFLLENQALGMGIFDLVLVIVVWAVIRFWLGRRYGANFIAAAGNFLLMLLVWGVFQLLCLGVVTIWERGGFSPLHRHLEREAEPERVIVIGQEE